MTEAQLNHLANLQGKPLEVSRLTAMVLAAEADEFRRLQIRKAESTRLKEIWFDSILRDAVRTK